MVPEHCQGKRDTATQPYSPYNPPPYPSRLTLPPIPKHRNGTIPWTVLLNPLIIGVHYVWTALSIIVQLSVSEGANHSYVTRGIILPALLQRNVPGANIRCRGTNPGRRLHMKSSPCEPPRDGRRGYSTVLQMGSTKSRALVNSCLDTQLSVKLQIPEEENGHCFTPQMWGTKAAESRCVSAVPCIDAEQALKLFWFSI